MTSKTSPGALNHMQPWIKTCLWVGRGADVRKVCTVRLTRSNQVLDVSRSRSQGFGMRRMLRIVLGSLFMMLGLVGLVLPVLQGWLFLGMGGLVLAQDIPIFAKMTCWIMARFPQTGRMAQRLTTVFGTLVECPAWPTMRLAPNACLGVGHAGKPASANNPPSHTHTNSGPALASARSEGALASPGEEC